MPKYQVEALRTIRSLQTAYAKGGRTEQAEQMRRVGDQIEKMAEELGMRASALRAKDADYAALKAAAGDVADWWKNKDSHCEVMPAPMLLDRLARLCGEK
jgi:hypothetical protein